MTQLMGFKTTDKKNIVCKLKKSLYGLKQSLDSGTSVSIASLEEKGTHAAIMTHVCITASYLEVSTSIYCYI